MSVHEIYFLITEKFGNEVILSSDFEAHQPYLVINPPFLYDICLFLKNDERLFFDYLHCLSGVDYGAKENKIAVVYHLYSLPLGHTIILKCEVPRFVGENENLPAIPSVSKVWRAAEWHERETYDLLGIEFVGNDDLRRMFMPEDWVGHPLRKDYKHEEEYHGIKIEYA